MSDTERVNGDLVSSKDPVNAKGREDLRTPAAFKVRPSKMALLRARSLNESDTQPKPGAMSVAGILLSFVTLVVLIYYGYTYQKQPEIGFILNASTWIVDHVKEECTDPASCLQVGDQVLAIGEINFSAFRSNRLEDIYKSFREQGEATVEFIRDGEVKVYKLESYGSHGVLARFVAFFLPALFWVMGTVTVIFLRPRDERWLLLTLYQFDTALWISSGLVGATQVAYSAIVFYVTLWYFLPLSVHLHLILPDPLFKRYHPWILWPLYLGTTYLMLMDLQLRLPHSASRAAALLAMATSLGLLTVRALLPAPRATQVANRLMLYGVGIGLGPIMLLVLGMLIDLQALLSYNLLGLTIGLFMIVFPLWPLTYIYAIYKHDLGTFEFRANRLLGTYGFFAIFIATYVFIYSMLVGIWRDKGKLGEDLLGLTLSLIFVAAGPWLYSKFQRLVERHVFAIKYRPEEVVSVFAEKIPTAFDRDILRKVILEEILPTLLIRQSALFVFGGKEPEILYQQELPEDCASLTEVELHSLLVKAGRYISFSSDTRQRLRWLRLVVPLSIQEKTIGIWLLGRRDPDDFYANSDITLLVNLANQIAPVIENFRLVEKARQEVLENRRLQEQLIQSQKMEAIGRLSAGVAHDFNNILSVIIGYSNLILAQYRNDERLQQAVSSVKDAGERAATLTKQLLAFSRQQVMEARITNLNDVVADVEKMLQRLAGEDIELTAKLGDNLPSVKIDPGQIGQVIINLVVNARDAMPDGGAITIETRYVVCRSDGRCHDGVVPGPYVLLTVRDTGTGVDPLVRGQIFEPYFTTKEHGKGTGLGLSMVYGIINQSRGYISVDSAVGQGSTFSIYLPPASVAETAVSQKLQRANAMDNRGSETVLLVEDEESVRSVTAEILQASGYRVLAAKDGAEALEIFGRHPESIDLLLTDVVMPHMKGPELAKRLCSQRPELKVVYMSGYNEESILGKRIGEEGSILLQKPFPPQTLTRRIREILDADGSASPSSVATAFFNS